MKLLKIKIKNKEGELLDVWIEGNEKSSGLMAIIVLQNQKRERL